MKTQIFAAVLIACAPSKMNGAVASTASTTTSSRERIVLRG
jgi:hypothetical protein